MMGAGDLEGWVSVELKHPTHDIVATQSSCQYEEADPNALVLAGIRIIGSIHLQHLLPINHQKLQQGTASCIRLAYCRMGFCRGRIGIKTKLQASLLVQKD